MDWERHFSYDCAGFKFLRFFIIFPLAFFVFWLMMFFTFGSWVEFSVTILIVGLFLYVSLREVVTGFKKKRFSVLGMWHLFSIILVVSVAVYPGAFEYRRSLSETIDHFFGYESYGCHDETVENIE